MAAVAAAVHLAQLAPAGQVAAAPVAALLDHPLTVWLVALQRQILAAAAVVAPATYGVAPEGLAALELRLSRSHNGDGR